jgi:GT2 family glycosyltransferase
MVLPDISKGVHEVIFIDNNSSDESVNYVKNNHPSVKILKMPQNKFIFALNDGVLAAKNDIVIFLNNDIYVENDFISPLLKHFDDPSVFAVTSRIIEAKTGKEQGSRTKGVFSNGIIYYEPLPHVEEASDCFFAVGGQAAFDKKKLIEIGMLDNLFYPMYHEDIDLSYRAWKHGWRVKYEPKSVIYHLGATTTNKVFTQFQFKSMVERNKFLLVFKNITDKDLFFKTILLFPFRLIQAFFKGNFEQVAGFFKVFKKIPILLQSRINAKKYAKLMDKQVFKIVSNIK